MYLPIGILFENDSESRNETEDAISLAIEITIQHKTETKCIKKSCSFL